MKNKFFFGLLFTIALIFTVSRGWAIDRPPSNPKPYLAPLATPTPHLPLLLAEDGGDSGSSGEGDSDTDAGEDNSDAGDGDSDSDADAMSAGMTASYDDGDNQSREGIARNLQGGNWDQAKMFGNGCTRILEASSP